MRIIGILQARDGSQRLPRKATTLISGLPLIEHVWNRLYAVGGLDKCAVSTSLNSPEIVGWCKLNDIPHYVGSEDDLLSRHLNAAITFKADAILRVTGDCLFHDPAMLDKMLGGFRKLKGVDALINWHLGERSYSEGLDAEIVTVKCMKKLNQDKHCPRENWLGWLDTNPNYNVAGWKYPEKLGADLHLSIDTPEDLERARRMIDWMGSNKAWDYKFTLKAYEGVALEA